VKLREVLAQALAPVLVALLVGGVLPGKLGEQVVDGQDPAHPGQVTGVVLDGVALGVVEGLVEDQDVGFGAGDLGG
jgi:hypothetical protein